MALWNYIKIIAVFFVLYFVSSFFVPSYNSYKQGSQSETNKIVTPPSPNQNELLNQVKLDHEWHLAGFKNIMEVSFTIKNNSKTSVKDFEILCVSYGKSGTMIDKNVQTIFDVVNAGESKHIDKFNMGFVNSQVDTVRCIIRSLKTD